MSFDVLYPLCFILFVFFPFSAMAQTYRNMSLGSSLTAQNDNSASWQSPSGEFAFGFRQIGNDGFLLAIWFNKIPDKAVVWSANGNSLVAQGSKVELTADGQLLLNDIATGKDTLVASVGTGVVAYAAMLDTGNFVLANAHSNSLWESFGHPTDTILPTQTINQGSRLYAPYTLTNYSRGRFLLTLESGGNLKLYTTNFPQDYPYYGYWNYTDTLHSGFQVIFNQSGSVYLIATNGTILKVILPYTFSNQDLYQRATLDYDGFLRYYVFRKSNDSSGGTWSALSLIPSNICMSIVQKQGGGACGFNSLCNQNQGRPICQCPSGYTLMDPHDALKGCKPNFVPHSCDGASSESDLFYMQEMQNASWQASQYDEFYGVTEDWCRQACLADCLCDVANYRISLCFLKAIPLLNGRIDPSYNGKAFIKIRKDNSTLGSDGAAKTKRKKEYDSTLIVAGSVLLSSLGVLNFLLPLMTYMAVSRVYSRKAMAIRSNPIMSGMNLKCFTFEEIKDATNKFKEEIGRGASATVFKGVLASDNGIGNCVAVKSLDVKVRGNDVEFNAEVSAIGRTSHRNLVQLLGFCDEGEHRMLVYEFMSNGSLASFVFGESRPKWFQRRHIALGIARGLLYLHEECSSQIVHCDIKPQNILLDDSFTARISDFGLAKLLRMDQTRTTTAIRGTKGYVAPEWFKNLPITVKVDVYSFGILLLEIICCRKKFEEDAEDENQMILADWAYDCHKQNKLHLLFPNDSEPMEAIKEMEKYVMIAMRCIEEDPLLRPTMKNVTLMLEGTGEVSFPPDPSSFINSTF
ncbi:hypothetical protein ACFX1T_005580 [Malus domestica]